MKLRVAGLIPESIVDGPGIRLALFVQGCSRGCPGCHNPEAQDPRGGVEMTVDQLRERIRSSRGIDGVTFSGGEPFEQPAPLAQLGEAILELGLNLVLYSGYTFEELLLAGDGDQNVRRLLQAGWLLVDGLFIMAQRDLTLPYRGSRNQRILHLPRSLRERKPVSWPAG